MIPGMVTVDEHLADEAIRDWLPAPMTRAPLSAMNSSAWLVSSGAERYVLKISDASEEPGLRVAAWLEARGLRTGAPVHMTVRDGRLVALLRFADGRPLATSQADVEALGETLGRAHSLLVGAPVPRGLQRWPWSWLDSGVIDDPDCAPRPPTRSMPPSGSPRRRRSGSFMEIRLPRRSSQVGTMSR